MAVSSGEHSPGSSRELLQSHVNRYRPFFSPAEVEELTLLHAKESQAGIDRPAQQANLLRAKTVREKACGFIDRIGLKMGFPRRSIATAQILYQRFHLFFPVKDWAWQDVCIAATLAASKLEDTLKKLREIQIAAHSVLAMLEGRNGLTEPDPQILEADRGKLIGIERLILETISFNFNLTSANLSYVPGGKDTFTYIVRMGKTLKASKEYIRIAYRLGIDVYRTPTVLSYPPHTIAAACLYLASYLHAGHPNSQINQTPSFDPLPEGMPAFEDGWETQFASDIDEIEDVCHHVLDLLEATGTTAPSLGREMNPKSPGEYLLKSPADSLASPAFSSASSTGPTATTPASVADYTALKIVMRRNAEARHSKHPPTSSKKRRSSNGHSVASLANKLGKNNVTIRHRYDGCEE
ncbi:uncharacterized protein L969DRAFT_92734 [Mixia osmundae IAM 14324]|uniref:Cyclin-like domain-containing protein n=1 Tax=Mixia osmundae (strain CBS 9802 / IAM 14324 / JCM 22182 / KY 12970) TaxID=764103 RepID=G7DYE4_MIXOS|nr:uncharacterized protein L969DRAFT_92734 [Mixia osmundae IAM 14324]KEI41506.1 hypothetical protein L969DRAFT_92734 [Mixia osmundae IAM 14324]GAA95604.1 hypothetical protein E5Q_02260 [Mixia osmundae IAM 14324]